MSMVSSGPAQPRKPFYRTGQYRDCHNGRMFDCWRVPAIEARDPAGVRPFPKWVLDAMEAGEIRPFEAGESDWVQFSIPSAPEIFQIADADDWIVRRNETSFHALTNDEWEKCFGADAANSPNQTEAK